MPNPAPSAVPSPPISSPSHRNTWSTTRERAPRDFSTPMSRRFSSTTMNSVLTMLNAATRTISARITNITAFSSFIQVNRLRLSSIQLLARSPGVPSALIRRPSARGASNMSLSRTSMPVTASPRSKNLCAAPIEVKPKLES